MTAIGLARVRGGMSPAGPSLRLLLAWVMAGLLGSTAATAGEIARYRLGDGEQTLYFGDPWHVRAELRGAKGPTTTLILNERQTANLRGEQPTGDDIPLTPKPVLPQGEVLLRVRDTGKEGSHAGIRGRWFELYLKSGRRERVLLSRDPHLRAVRLGWRYLIDALGSRPGLGDFRTLDRLLRHPDLSGWALLQWPGVASLTSLRSAPLPDDLFSLTR
ncbi:MAG: hypothetical protein D6786_05605 [Gammaproteobacteria bacterium]|nr:MAG: hypothetical protein D6786_05605 [Gammaproteobacteria bacterium]